MILCIAALLPACNPVKEFWNDTVDEDDQQIARSDCQRHFEQCLASPLSKRRSAYGESQCQPCFRRCRQEGYWPEESWDGKDCQWWRAK